MKIIDILFFLLLVFFIVLFLLLIKIGNKGLKELDSGIEVKPENIYYPYKKYSRVIMPIGIVCILGIFLFPVISDSFISTDGTQHEANQDEEVPSDSNQQNDVHESNRDNTPIVVLSDSVHDLIASITLTAYAADAQNKVDPASVQIKSTTGDTYSIEQVKHRQLLIPYVQGEYEVFFLGYINEKGHWDGHCLINTYRDGILIFANSVDYSDGIEMDYEQYYVDDDGLSFIEKKAVPAKDIYDQETDANSNRYVYQGATWTYRNYSPVQQHITMDNPVKEQLYTPDSLRLGEYSDLYKYYNGLSSAYINKYGNRTVGAYDLIGDSDYAEFYEDGTVRMVYHGKFKAGKPDDQEGGSWEIVCDKEKDIHYCYNIGLFTAGSYDYSDSRSEGYVERNQSNLSLSQISVLIEGTSFENMELDWNQELIGD